MILHGVTAYRVLVYVQQDVGKIKSSAKEKLSVPTTDYLMNIKIYPEVLFLSCTAVLVLQVLPPEII